MSGTSTVTFRHEQNKSYKLKGVKHTIKESVIDGEKGLSFMFLKKVGEGEDDFYKVYVKENKETGKYEVDEKKGSKEEKSEVSEAEVKKMVKANKDLKFVLDYMENGRGTYKGKKVGGGEVLPNESQCGGGKKKSSKKASKKASKKGSKKGSKKMRGGGKKKSSKKASKKGSKKH